MDRPYRQMSRPLNLLAPATESPAEPWEGSSQRRVWPLGRYRDGSTFVWSECLTALAAGGVGLSLCRRVR